MKNISKSFPVFALKDVDFTLKREIHALMGCGQESLIDQV